jgi:hypothetical protein
LEKYPSFLQNINETNEQIDPLVYGIYELFDLIDQTYQYYNSDLNGFKGEEKIKKVSCNMDSYCSHDPLSKFNFSIKTTLFIMI